MKYGKFFETLQYCYAIFKVMNRHSKEFREVVARLQAGEIDRKQAAQILNVPPGTLGSWLLRSKLNESTRLKVKPLVGAVAARVAAQDPDNVVLLEKLTAEVLSGVYRSCLQAQKANPSVNLSTLTKRVHAAKVAAGIPIVTKARR